MFWVTTIFTLYLPNKNFYKEMIIERVHGTISCKTSLGAYERSKEMVASPYCNYASYCWAFCHSRQQFCNFTLYLRIILKELVSEKGRNILKKSITPCSFSKSLKESTKLLQGMTFVENVGKGVGFLAAISLFSIILSLIRMQFSFQTILWTILWTGIIVLILAGIQYFITQQKVEDVS